VIKALIGAVLLLVCVAVFGQQPPTRAVELESAAKQHSTAGNHAAALPLREGALRLLEETLGQAHIDITPSMLNLANTHAFLGNFDKALILHAKALAIREKVLGLEHLDTAEALSEMGMSYWALGQPDKALPLQMRALAIYEKSAGQDALKAYARKSLATTYSALGNYDKALPLQLQLLEFLDVVVGRETANTLAALNELSLTYTRLAQPNQALQVQLRALQITEKLHGLEHLDTAVSLNNLALTYKDLGQHDKALPLQIRALAIREKMLGSEHPSTAGSLNNLAETYRALAQFDKALDLQMRALAIREKVLGPAHPDTALGLNDLALNYAALAQYEKALPLQMRALAINEKVLGAEHPSTAIGLGNLADTYAALAQHDKALPLQLRALEILEKVRGPEHPSTAWSLNNLARTYSALAQYDKAIPLRLRALSITEKVLGPEHPHTAGALNNLAETYRSLAQYDKALPMQMRSLTITEKVLGPEHPDTAVGLGNLALTYEALGQVDKALPLQVRALAIKEKVLGPEHPSTAISFGNLASSLWSLGQHDLAIGWLKLAVNAYQNQRETVSRIGSAELRSYTDSVFGVYQDLSDALTHQGRLAEAQLVLDMLKEDEQFDFIRRAVTADPRKTTIAYTSTEQAWLGRYRQIADRLGALGKEELALQKQEKLGLSPQQKQRQAALAGDLKVAQAAFEAFLGQMREGFAQAGQARKVEVEEVSAQAMRETQGLLKGLGDDVALQQYYITDKRVGMLLTTPGIQLARSSDIDAKDLNRKIGEWRRLLQDPKSNPQPAAQALYEILVAPVAKDLDDLGAKNIMLSLDGALRYLPFGALHDGKQYLAQRWNLPIYTSVTKNRLRDGVAPQWQAAGLGVTREWPEFKPLAGVRAEMGAIVKTATGGLMPGEVYLDDAFTALRLRDVSQRQFPVLHVASHFRFSPGTEVNSFLLLGDGARLTLGDIRTQNYRFDNVDLLTLSACDTGLGGGRDEQGKEIECIFQPIVDGVSG
jgi:CHAT domain-containing protein/tetratricopeptide (TPR) repeat protein